MPGRGAAALSSEWQPRSASAAVPGFGRFRAATIPDRGLSATNLGPGRVHVPLSNGRDSFVVFGAKIQQ